MCFESCQVSCHEDLFNKINCISEMLVLRNIIVSSCCFTFTCSSTRSDIRVTKLCAPKLVILACLIFRHGVNG
jgi:hypothetical protein